MKKALLSITLVTLLSVLIYSCSSDDDDSAPPSVIQTPTGEPEPDATQYTLTVTAGGGGTVSTEGGTYDEGTEVTITATPDEDYHFIGFEGIEGYENTITVNINGNKTIEPIFIKKR